MCCCDCRGRYGELYKLIEEAEQGVSVDEGQALKQSFESDAFAVDQLIVYMRQVWLLLPPPAHTAVYCMPLLMLHRWASWGAYRA